MAQESDLFAKVQTVCAFLIINVCMFFGKESSENFTIGQLECESCLYKVGQYIAMPRYVNSELSWISIPFGSAYTNTDKVKQKKISLFVWLLCFM